jgi:hypothetical protein
VLLGTWPARRRRSEREIRDVSTRTKIRRLALVCAGAMAIVPLSAGAASAQSAEDCEQFEPLGDAFVEGCEDFAEQFEDDGDEGEDDGDPFEDGLRQLCDEFFGALDEQAQEECHAQVDALLGDEGDDEVGDPESEESDPGPQPDDGEPEADTTDADPSGDLPVTGGAAGLAGLALFGAAAALRRVSR